MSGRGGLALLLVTALLLVAGAGVRIVSAPEPGVEWDTGVSDTLVVNGLAEVRQGAEAALERERIRSRPLGPGERIDPNRADELQLDRLPRVGPALAARIVAWREEHGPFASLAEIDEVDGVGPGLLETISPHLDLPARSGGGGAGAGGTTTPSVSAHAGSSISGPGGGGGGAWAGPTAPPRRWVRRA